VCSIEPEQILCGGDSHAGPRFGSFKPPIFRPEPAVAQTGILAVVENGSGRRFNMRIRDLGDPMLIPPDLAERNPDPDDDFDDTYGSEDCPYRGPMLEVYDRGRPGPTGSEAKGAFLSAYLADTFLVCEDFARWPSDRGLDVDTYFDAYLDGRAMDAIVKWLAKTLDRTPVEGERHFGD
jgi:hypothetical protein